MRLQHRNRGLSLNGRVSMPRPPIHPGEHLRIDLEELGMSQRQLARAIAVPPNRIGSIIKGERSITADTALRLARWMNTTPEYWLNLQRNYDLKVAQMEIGERITEEITPLQPVVS